jgi:hypothetical protein
MILAVCGELCNLQRRVGPIILDILASQRLQLTARDSFRMMCWTSLVPGNIPPLISIPEEFREHLEMHGRLKVESWYIQDVYLGKKAKQNGWKEETIEGWKALALEGKFRQLPRNYSENTVGCT